MEEEGLLHTFRCFFIEVKSENIWNFLFYKSNYIKCHFIAIHVNKEGLELLNISIVTRLAYFKIFISSPMDILQCVNSQNS